MKKSSNSLDKVWEEVVRLHNSDAIIKRRGCKYGNVKPDRVLQKAGEELLELATAKNDAHGMEEAGDLLAVIFHYCVVMGWNPEDISDGIFAKLKKRVKEK